MDINGGIAMYDAEFGEVLNRLSRLLMLDLRALEADEAVRERCEAPPRRLRRPEPISAPTSAPSAASIGWATRKAAR
jgi:hypothetical protein